MNDILFKYPIKIVEIETYTKCNRKCQYCPNRNHIRPDAFMSKRLYQQILEQLVGINFEGRISYHFYNEPLLDSRLLDFIAEARFQIPRCRIVLYSNGDFMTKEIFFKLIDAGIDLAWVTNHGLSKKHCSWRHELPYEDALKLRYHTNKNPDIYWTNRGGLIPEIAQLDNAIKTPCTAIATTLVVTALGDVVLCYEDYNGREKLGNLHQNSIEEIWHSERAVYLRKLLLVGNRTCSELCKQCNNVEMQTLEQFD